ncbi:MAG TPA: sigma-70 family RNA polymerase sigma factor [Gemmatimonadales bacterium]|jgi:RNA polymerase sigma-70 factor (ECF subfamily)|nr:sigma-70 family RNA polymerase sigma factor [Gemmatimonadales bacterium]
MATVVSIPADQLLAEYAPALKNFLGARCRDADLTAELMQEVAARLVTAAPRLQLKNGNLRGYLFRIAASVWHDHLRRELVRRRGAHVLQEDERAAPSADEPLMEHELRDAVRRVVADLPAAQRDVVRLRHERGLTFQQIADRLGRPLGTVLTQMRAALARIAPALEEYR